MFCKNCGAQIPDGARFCPECGTPAVSSGPVNQTAQETYTGGGFSTDYSADYNTDYAQNQSADINSSYASDYASDFGQNEASGYESDYSGSYRQNDSLTTTSAPAATLFNKNSLGTKLMQGAILNIKQNDDGTMSFYYRAGQQAGTSVGEAIRETEAPTLPRRIYTLDGRSVRNADAFGGRNADATSLGHGIYIVDGKKVVR